MEEKKSIGNRIRNFFFIEKEGAIKGISIGGTFILALLCIAFSYFFFKPTKKKDEILPKEGFADKFIYKKDTVKYINFQDELSFFGKIASNENNVIPVFSLVSGQVENVKVSLGDYVKQGQVLARIKSGDVSDILSEYRASEYNLNLAKKNLQVAETLYHAKFSSELDVLNARRDYKNTLSEYKKSSDKLKIYHIMKGESNPYFNIYAPMDGFIIQKNINNNIEIRGDNNENLFTISNIKTVWVYADIYEQDLPRIQQGQKVSITTEAYPGKEFNGEIDNISSVLDPSSRTARIRMVIDNSLGLLKPEMTAMVKVHIPGNERMLAVEPRGVIFDKDKYFVVKVVDTTFKVTLVDIEKKTSLYTYIRKGLREGEVIVGEGSLILYNEIINKP